MTKFYDLHVTADEGHQEVALNEMIRPVVAAEPERRADIARGVLEGHVAPPRCSRTHLAGAFARRALVVRSGRAVSGFVPSCAADGRPGRDAARASRSTGDARLRRPRRRGRVRLRRRLPAPRHAAVGGQARRARR